MEENKPFARKYPWVADWSYPGEGVKQVTRKRGTVGRAAQAVYRPQQNEQLTGGPPKLSHTVPSQRERARHASQSWSVAAHQHSIPPTGSGSIWGGNA
jgi:hypothetical protein